jgi:hypothetical protein
MNVTRHNLGEGICTVEVFIFDFSVEFFIFKFSEYILNSSFLSFLETKCTMPTRSPGRILEGTVVRFGDRFMKVVVED